MTTASPPSRRTACAISTPRPPPITTTARDGLHRGHPAARPHALELTQARARAARPDRRRSRAPRGRRCGGRRRPRRPEPASRPVPRSRSMPLSASQVSCPASGVIGHHEVAEASAASTSTSAVARCGLACTVDRLARRRSRFFDGTHAQYEHSPPTSSRSTTATRRPPSASAPRSARPAIRRRARSRRSRWSCRQLLAGTLRTMYSAYQSGQSGSASPVRSSCLPCAAAARFRASVRSLTDFIVVHVQLPSAARQLGLDPR